MKPFSSTEEMLHLQIKAIYFCFNINTTRSHTGCRCYDIILILACISISNERCFILFFFTGLFLAIFLPKLLLYLITTTLMKSVGLFCKVFLLILGHFMVMKTQRMAFKYFASKSKVSWENKWNFALWANEIF